jgi:hypothetical protein
MKKQLTILFLIGCASFTVAQTGSIKVRVFNQSNIESLPFVTVDIEGPRVVSQQHGCSFISTWFNDGLLKKCRLNKMYNYG